MRDKYFFKCSPVVVYSLLTWLTANLELPNTPREDIITTLDKRSSVTRASYSTSLIVAWNVRTMAYLNGFPSGRTKTKLDHETFLKEDRSI